MVSKKIHATEKPLLLLKEILRIVLFPGSSILVPFLGSGSTLRAAYRLGHTGIGWDLAPEHKEAFLRRVQDDQKDGEDLEGEE
jgi:site-specific DNA-methyltransferase (adenine-specific)